MTTQYSFFTKVVKIEEVPPLGWFVGLEGSHESLCFGPEKPDLKVGDVVKVAVRKQGEQ